MLENKLQEGVHEKPETILKGNEEETGLLKEQGVISVVHIGTPDTHVRREAKLSRKCTKTKRGDFDGS